ncbi:MAG TPA: sulfate ABC transporter substrate-binding protein, partial [Propionibacteriaceae bacterium]
MSIITRRRVLQAAAGTIALGLTATLSGCVGGAAQPASDASGATTLHLVGFAVPKEANNAIQKKFAETPEGEGVVWQESYGASGDQSRAVANGLKADYV